MKNLKKMLAVFLMISLGAVAACSDDDNGSNNADNNSNVPGQNNDDNNTGNNDNNTGNNDNNTGNNDNNTGNNDNNTGNNDNNTGNNDNNTGGETIDGNTLLKDLTSAQVQALCDADNAKVAPLFDPSTSYGQANCLIIGAFDGYELSEDDAEAIEICEESQEFCLEDSFELPAECMIATDCSATVAEFEACTDEYIAGEKALLDQATGKTCSDYATEDGFDALDELLDQIPASPACEALVNKCPNIFGE